MQISIHLQKRQPSPSSFAKNSSPEIYESRRRGSTPVPNLTRLPVDSLEVASVLSGAVSRNIESCQSSAVLSPLLSHTLPPPRYRCPSILSRFSLLSPCPFVEFPVGHPCIGQLNNSLNDQLPVTTRLQNSQPTCTTCS